MIAFSNLQMHYSIIICIFILILLVIVEPTDDYYKTLKVPLNASTEQIKKAYRDLMQKYHPDKNKNDPKAKEITQKIIEAYGVLSDEEKRRNFDNEFRPTCGSSYTTSSGSSTTSGGSSTTPGGSSTTPGGTNYTASGGSSTTSGGSSTSSAGTSSSGTSSHGYTNFGILLYFLLYCQQIKLIQKISVNVPHIFIFLNGT
ncbi:unnamed protein product [Meloidogyne enterolobii]|uniref:Uncharacterized protein n=1 Tax=Meloidogyne enterolobii TaxID=390850 RepID=A0ACB1ABV7_MELEN